MSQIVNNWPLAFVCGAMIVAAVIDGWKLKVPNWLTFPVILGGLLLGLAHNFEGLPGTGEGGIGAALAGVGLGFLLLFPVYAIGGMGAGDVKMQMGFGSWIGAFYGAKAGLWIVWWSFALAAIIGGVIAAGMILLRGDFRKNLANTRAILGDLTKAESFGQVTDNAARRKPTLHLLPYGIPLCLGFIAHLVWWHSQGA
jgi:prepilin peptidase CpaA